MLQIVATFLLFYPISTVVSQQVVQPLQQQQQQHQPVHSSFCLDSTVDSFIKSTNASSHTWTPCPWNSEDAHFKNLQTSFLTKTTTGATNTSSVVSDEPEETSRPMNITFHCFLTSKDTCTKAQKAFQKAGDIIASVILFREPVNVNATLVSFCDMSGVCHDKEKVEAAAASMSSDKDGDKKYLMTLGGSSPARAMPLLNTDGLLRLHPQALVKQFGIDEHPAFAPYDIQSVFNADAPFWFEEDGVPIAAHQADFLFVVLHEFMHGLGFYSSWNEYISVQALTPDPSPFIANQFMSTLNPSTSALHPSQFLESAMDRLMRTSAPGEHKLISDITRNLNKIQARTVKELLRMPEFEKAAKQMGIYATTPGSLQLDFVTTHAAVASPTNGTTTAATAKNEPLILETGLKPFQPGSSISHVDYSKYTHSPDFLMRYMQDRGVTLSDAVKRGGGDHPIGPLLLSVLEAMGYSTIRNPDVIPPLIAFHEQGMTGLIIDQFDDVEKNGRSGGGLRRKHPHHDTSTNVTDNSGRFVSFAAASPSSSIRNVLSCALAIFILSLCVFY